MSVGAGRYFRLRKGQYAVKNNDFLGYRMHKKPKKIAAHARPTKNVFCGPTVGNVFSLGPQESLFCVSLAGRNFFCNFYAYYIPGVLSFVVHTVQGKV